ncbi:hypothetical protein LX15_000828 [Streptoalloteichus tenebrarius]|uniref:Uncharacterized protein n=1 Tax=Streptoalloteichus tenebrarius (strain ATCC 17920 / DSM 40477 / JCM 4838 / CBS 697.72 / NBRC 16177 / NCIMB 11028 / NRRL B-12390 / A12253. 1 / ISP 5477) TaxID=1933 RepID=A0ABT1HNR2_STRSD|nr:hypothetical protein [Streptoalloteichus tenebrarius]MCP2257143.1 hypothetical protein [Streptoalloteichus tenebrarius]BFE98776.1 hypothetical protein GCM10020241_04520 [Streptoalloteichus tenebrarius]
MERQDRFDLCLNVRTRLQGLSTRLDDVALLIRSRAAMPVSAAPPTFSSFAAVTPEHPGTGITFPTPHNHGER